jgi:hypothetical protein
VAGLVVVGVAGHHRGVDPVHAAGFVVALAILGLLGVAGAALVAGSERVDRATRRAAWPAVAAAAVLVALADSSAAGRHVALWSGPWGWAVQPLAGAAAAWPVAVVLLIALTAAITTLAVRRRGATPTERHLVRAEARGGAVAALYSMNAHYVRRSLTAVSSGPVTARRAHRLRPPRSPRLAVAWRDAIAALAVRQRLGEALALAAGGTAVCLVNAAHPVAVGAGALAIYAGASRLLEPLRAEIDQPWRVRVLLRAPIGRVLVQHTLVPLVVVVTGALLAVAGCTAAGALPDDGAAAALLALLATPSITLCAALSSRRGGSSPAERARGHLRRHERPEPRPDLRLDRSLAASGRGPRRRTAQPRRPQRPGRPAATHHRAGGRTGPARSRPRRRDVRAVGPNRPPAEHRPAGCRD